MNVVEIVFSPTGGTEKVAHIIGKHWSENPAKIDLSDAKADFTNCEIKEQDMVLIAMPGNRSYKKPARSEKRMSYFCKESGEIRNNE